MTNGTESTEQIEKQPLRPMVEVQAEYERICARVGELTYRIEIAKAELQPLLQKLLSLNQEAEKAKEPKQ